MQCLKMFVFSNNGCVCSSNCEHEIWTAIFVFPEVHKCLRYLKQLLFWWIFSVLDESARIFQVSLEQRWFSQNKSGFDSVCTVFHLIFSFFSPFFANFFLFRSFFCYFLCSLFFLHFFHSFSFSPTFFHIIPHFSSIFPLFSSIVSIFLVFPSDFLKKILLVFYFILFQTFMECCITIPRRNTKNSVKI